MRNERKDTANADMAGTGYDSGIPQDGEGIRRGDPENDNGQAGERNPSQNTQLSTSEQELEPAEVTDALPEDLSEDLTSVIQSMEWNAPLPPPNVFNQYSDKAQDAIIREFEKGSERNDKTLEAYRELDKEESERRNEILNQESRKVNTALWMTFMINISLIVIAFVAVLLGQTNAAIAAITVLGGVAVGKAFSQRNNIK